MQKLFNTFTQPYPFENYNERSHVKTFLKSLAQGLFIALFLRCFKPFGIDEWMQNDSNVVYYIWCFGLITSLADITFEFLAIPLFPKFFNDEKNYQKQTGVAGKAGCRTIPCNP